MPKKILGESLEKAEPTIAEKALNQLKAMGTANYFSQDAKLLQETDIFLNQGTALFCIALIKIYMQKTPEEKAEIDKKIADTRKKKRA